MTDFGLRGREIQFGVIESESDNLARGDDHYSENEVAQAAVHTRQDLVLVVSLLTDMNIQLRLLRWMAFVVLIAMIVIVARLLSS